jgi:hypothetical protein
LSRFSLTMLGNLGKFWDKLKSQYDDDVIDRLNYIYTNFILLAFALTIAAKQYVGKPLQCWVPAQFKGGWEAYVENYCFVENTYWVPMQNEIPIEHKEREELEIQYYQWVPFVLALQALLFYLPRMVWSMLNKQSGLNITSLIQTAFTTKKEGIMKKLRDTETGAIAKGLTQAIDYRYNKPTTNTFTRALSAGWGAYVTILYLFVKFLFLLNVIVQFVILNKFLGPQYTFWGYDILSDILNGRQWQQSGHFPRVTLCDIDVRTLGNLHRWTVQCVLMINMFNEKIYLFLWWWLLLVALLTAINLAYWSIISLTPSFSYSFVGRYLQYKQLAKSQLDVEQFVRQTLRSDGVTVLRLVSDNCGDLVTAEIVEHLWKIYDSKATHKVPNVMMQSPEKVKLLDASSDTSTEKY